MTAILSTASIADSKANQANATQSLKGASFVGGNEGYCGRVGRSYSTQSMHDTNIAFANARRDQERQRKQLRNNNV